MHIDSLSVGEISERLSGDGLAFDFGAIRARIRGQVDGWPAAMKIAYSCYPLTDPSGIFGVTAELRRVRGIRSSIFPQINLIVDGSIPFEPFPAATHMPLLEWGLNFHIANRCHGLLLLHSGALARGKSGLLLPAVPGAGKSTLTAALMGRGYRLLSDEFGAIDPASGALQPIVRPIALKNESIEVIARFAPTLRIGPSFPNTRKGTVAHVAPSVMSTTGCREPAMPRLVVFPRYAPRESVLIESIPKARAFVKLIGNSFNYEILGRIGFDTVTRLVESVRCVTLRYGDLDSAIGAIDAILDTAPAVAARSTAEASA